jgi:hypothetical protein
MALSLANGVTAVRDVLNEATASFWSDTQIENWIKEGTRNFSTKSLLAQTTGDITLVANQLSYDSTDEAFIANVLKIHTAFYDDAGNNYKGLIKVEPEKIGNVATFTAGDPKYFCVFGKKIYIWPLTTASIVTAGGLATVLYSQETEDFTVIADEYQHLPIMWALGRAKQKDQKFGEAMSFFEHFNSEIDFERQDKELRGDNVYEDYEIMKTRRPRNAT